MNYRKNNQLNKEVKGISANAYFGMSSATYCGILLFRRGYFNSN